MFLRQPLRRLLSTAQNSRTHSPFSTQVTTLANGVRVASQATPGHFIGAGVYVDAGSRFEDDSTRGCSYFLDRMGYKSTKNRTADEMMNDVEALGGQFMVSSSRESILYQGVSYSHSLPSMISILSDTVLNPTLDPIELEVQRQSAEWEISELRKKPEMILPEVLHECAFNQNTLGNPVLCPSDRLREIQREDLINYNSKWFRPDRIVVAGVGVLHENLLELADKHFGDFKVPSLEAQASTSSNRSTSNVHSISSGKPSLFKSISTAASSLASVSSIFSPPLRSTHLSLPWEQLAKAKAEYTGGQMLVHKPGLDFTHLYVGFEGLSIHDPQIYALATLQMLLGGGGSFSAGGPGKGMYSRLYTSVLNYHHYVDFCSAFHHCYNDSGLFGIQISIQHDYAKNATDIVAKQLESILGEGGVFGLGNARNPRGISEVELSRAKNQLKSSLVMALESRMVQCEDLGRQIQVHGKKISVEEMQSRIDAVTVRDIYNVANRVLRPQKTSGGNPSLGEPTIVAMGDIAALGDVSHILKSRGFGTGKKRERFLTESQWDTL